MQGFFGDWCNSAMNYQLAKELKGAGFPFREVYNIQVAFAFGLFDFDGTPYLKPTLEELIEATPRLDFVARQTGEALEKWHAGCRGDGSEASSGLTISKGTTPTEAVARLWLALNKTA
jgi:hypothetical protein